MIGTTSTTSRLMMMMMIMMVISVSSVTAFLFFSISLALMPKSTNVFSISYQHHHAPSSIPIHHVPKSLKLHAASPSSLSPPPENFLEEVVLNKNYASIWHPMKNMLGQVAVFSCVDNEGDPKEYEYKLDNKKNAVFFFMDVNDAKAELQKIKTNNGHGGMGNMAQIVDDESLDDVQLYPFPLGQVYEMSIMASSERKYDNGDDDDDDDDDVMTFIIPSLSALQDANHPDDSNIVESMNDSRGRIGCMDVQSELMDDIAYGTDGNDGVGGSGRSVSALFTTKKEAEDYLKIADLEHSESESPDQDGLEVTALSLSTVIQLQAQSQSGVDEDDILLVFFPSTSYVEFMSNPSNFVSCYDIS